MLHGGFPVVDQPPPAPPGELPLGPPLEAPAPPGEWSPVWSPLEDSPQFKYGLLQPYFLMEKSLGTYEDHKSYMSYGDYMECKDFFRLLRESRGYDIVSYPSFMLEREWLNRALRPLDEDFELANAFYRENLRLKMEAIVNKINADAKCHGEMYAVGSFINNVRNIPHELSLLTFTVKQIKQIDGRFKFLDVEKTVQGMVSKQRRGKVEYLVEEWRFLPQQVAVHSSKPGLLSSGDGDGDGDGDGYGDGYGYGCGYGCGCGCGYGDGARVLCIGGGSDSDSNSNSESLMDWE